MEQHNGWKQSENNPFFTKEYSNGDQAAVDREYLGNHESSWVWSVEDSAGWLLRVDFTETALEAMVAADKFEEGFSDE